jgi:ribosomal protein S18 acetylase RimI-like enzyme
VAAGLDAASLRAILLTEPLGVTVAVDGDKIVGLVASAPDEQGASTATRSLLAVGVTPSARGAGLATAMLRAHLERFAAGVTMRAVVTLAERDPVEPLDRATRAAIARRLLEGSGFAVAPAKGLLARADSGAIDAERLGTGGM